MKKNNVQAIRLAFVFVLTIACLPVSNLLAPTATPLAIDTSVAVTESPLPEITPTLIGESVPIPTGTIAVLPPLEASSLPELYTFIQAPEGLLAQPYVILRAFQSLPDVSIEISGIINSKEFVCPGAPCAVPVPFSSQVVFQAISSAGNTSEQIAANIRVEVGVGGYYVFIDSINQFTSFSDSCLRYWEIQDYSNPAWAQFVQFPHLLNTNKTLHHLATNLILRGIVNVEGCPAGGLSTGLDWPTGCGLERARSAMIEWQNQFDEYIWLASQEVGIPPKILKTLIEVESQFWPGDQRFYVDEIGLGQINQLGVDALLRRKPQIYQQACKLVLSDFECQIPYTLMSQENQRLIRGALVQSQSSICANCEYGFDLDNAKQSVLLIAQMLEVNCEYVKDIVDDNLAADLDDDWEEPYEDLWKLTLMAYHSGLACVNRSIVNTAKDNIPFTWENVSENITCDSGRSYVDGFWGNLLRFDSYRYSQTTQELVQYAPVFKEPTPFPTAILSSGQLIVRVFLDANQNGIPEANERMNGITVQLQAENGTQTTSSTVNGQAEFDLSNFPANIGATVNLPGLYRSETFEIPAQGTMTIDFIFEQPTLPTIIP